MKKKYKKPYLNIIPVLPDVLLAGSEITEESKGEEYGGMVNSVKCADYSDDYDISVGD